jgi:hypothetical protein
MWVRFTGEFWWRPRRQVRVRYRAGTTANVTRACGQAAIGAGRAAPATNPKSTKPSPAAPAA